MYNILKIDIWDQGVPDAMATRMLSLRRSGFELRCLTRLIPALANVLASELKVLQSLTLFDEH